MPKSTPNPNQLPLFDLDSLHPFQAEEIWRLVPNCDGRYEASSEGQIRRALGWNKWKNYSYRNQPGKLLHPHLATQGYYYLRVNLNGEWKHTPVHRLIAAAFHGPCPDGFDVNHIDLNKTNNRPGNLEYISHADNLRHARAHKHWEPYTVSPPPLRTTELAETDREIIRVLLVQGVDHEYVASLFRVPPSTVVNIALTIGAHIAEGA